MIIRKYDCLGNTYKKETLQASGIITNKLGSFYTITLPQNQSRYDGFYILSHKNNEHTDWEMYKIIDEIIFHNPPSQLIWDNGILKTNTASFCITNNNSLIVASKDTYIIDMDCRHIYDDTTQGRIYSIEETRFKELPAIIIAYTKFADDQLTQKAYTKYVCIMGYEKVQQIKTWQEKFYSYDTQREKRDCKKFIFRLCQITGNAIIHAADTKENALRYCYEDSIHYNYHLSITQKKNIEFLEHIKPLKKFPHPQKEEQIALGTSILALRSLVTKCSEYRGIWAGLPWFFHFWTRDELISLGGVIASDEIHFAIDIIKKYNQSIDKTGLLPNRLPHANLHSADGIGLYYHRLHQLIKKLRDQSAVMQYFSSFKLEELKRELTKHVQRYESCHTKGFLVHNNSKETWMDTDINYKGFRAGKRIEIQALYIKMHMLLRDLCLLTLDKEYKYHESEIRKIKNVVKQTFVHNDICIDGIEENNEKDMSVRPNIFLAYYFCPQMLSKQIWQKTFDAALPKLWLQWGGVATLDKNNPEFCDTYSGEQNQSYHRGDSWYFINNIAALSMQKLNKGRYQKYIQKIIEASTREILQLGAMGCHAEISSAKEQQAHGCTLQAWSCATYIELILEKNK